MKLTIDKVFPFPSRAIKPEEYEKQSIEEFRVDGYSNDENLW